MDTLAKKCIEDHRNQVVKTVPNLPKKFFLKPAPTSSVESAFLDSYLRYLTNTLSYQRVEKRLNRAQATWLLDKNIAHVTRIVKNLAKYFGFQNKDGLFLHPEEILFLLETNRIEVHLKTGLLSVENAYEIVLNYTDIRLSNYLIYKKLVSLGYKLTKYKSIDINKNKKSGSKRKLQDGLQGIIETVSTLGPLKKLKADLLVKEIKKPDNKVNNISLHTVKESEYVNKIFSEIRKNMPINVPTQMNTCLEPHYNAVGPSNINKNESNLNLIICKDYILDQKAFKSESTYIYGSCTDDVAFYKIAEVCLPHI